MNVKRLSSSSSRSPAAMPQHNNLTTSLESQPQPLPLVVSLNCIENTTLEAECLSGVAVVEHVSLSRLAESRIESAAAVLLHSLAFLPRAAQRRLRPWQLILCLGSSDRAVDSALASDLGLNRLVHVDVSRAEEVADTVMALFRIAAVVVAVAGGDGLIALGEGRDGSNGRKKKKKKRGRKKNKKIVRWRDWRVWEAMGVREEEGVGGDGRGERFENWRKKKEGGRRRGEE